MLLPGTARPLEERMTPLEQGNFAVVSQNLDTTHVPTGERAGRRLVDALRNTDDRAERHFLEVKSDVDLGTALGRAKVAKFILGAANRMPSSARKYFQGHAVMVLGIGGRDVHGIEPVEMLQLQQWISPYLPARPPGWDIQRVPADGGREVLLVIVDPPEQGQPIYVCCKNFQADNRKHSLRDGAIYVRGDGETREATSDDLAGLIQRASGAPVAGVSVVAQGSALRYRADTEGLRKWIRQHRDGLLAALPNNAEPDPVFRKVSDLGGAAFASLQKFTEAFTVPEDRTEEAYRAQVAAWEAECIAALPTALDVLAAGAWTPLTFRIESDSWLEDVEVKIHLEGDVRGVEQDAEARGLGLLDIMPRRPRRWGPRQQNPLMVDPGRRFAPLVPTVALPPSRGSFKNGGSTDVIELVGDIRPHGVAVAGENLDMILLVDDANLEHVDASWHLTARDQHRVYEGRLTVPIEDRPIGELVRQLHST